MEKLLLIDEILLIITIFVLFFFTTVKGNIKVTRFLYLIFGVTLIPIGIEFIKEGYKFIEYIWFFVFSLCGVIVSIYLFFVYGKVKGTENEQMVNEKMQKMGRKTGFRRIGKNISSSFLKK